MTDEPFIKNSTAPISLVNWNIQFGSESSFWRGNNWRKRKIAIETVLKEERPDILCVQEALSGQLNHLKSIMPGYDHIGVGRDDGAQKGEHCAILFRKERLRTVRSGTFWLSDTPDAPGNTWDGMFMRICTWAQLLDVTTEKEVCVFNVHFPLNPFARQRSARLVVEKIRLLCPDKNVVLTGDFNSGPNSKPWRCIEESGLTNAETLSANGNKASPTYHLAGHPICCLDAVFVAAGMPIVEHRKLSQNVDGVWPSDHFGISVSFKLES